MESRKLLLAEFRFRRLVPYDLFDTLLYNQPVLDTGNT